VLTFTYRIGPDVQIRFTEKPPADVRHCLKAHGFRWSPQAGLWWRRKVIGAAEVIAGLRRLIEPRKPDGACWMCGNPDGYFRNEGAATPVRCDECQAIVRHWQAMDARTQRDWILRSQGAVPDCHDTQMIAARYAYARRATPTDPSDIAYEDACARACGF